MSCFFSISNARNYYPVAIGNNWVFRQTDDKDTSRVIEISKLTKEMMQPAQGEPLELPGNLRQESMRVILDRTETKRQQAGRNRRMPTTKRFVYTKADGIKQIGLSYEFPSRNNNRQGWVMTFKYDPPQDYLPNSIRLATKWTLEGEHDNVRWGRVITRKVNREVVKLENVRCPAGTFRNCLKVSEVRVFERDGVARRGSSVGYIWLAPKVGPVKMSMPIWRGGGGERVFELVKYQSSLGVEKQKGSLSITWGDAKKKP
tara:strand:- start:82 stop:858 length:777 start_codon:yes stop_codon:yes gene_type:complete